MVTCRISSCNPECTKYTCRYYSKEGLAYIENEKRKKERIYNVSRMSITMRSLYNPLSYFTALNGTKLSRVMRNLHSVRCVN